jgi:hypothetical protein
MTRKEHQNMTHIPPPFIAEGAASLRCYDCASEVVGWEQVPDGGWRPVVEHSPTCPNPDQSNLKLESRFI